MKHQGCDYSVAYEGISTIIIIMLRRLLSRHGRGVHCYTVSKRSSSACSRLDLSNLAQWIGKGEQSIETLSSFPANAFEATLSLPDTNLSRGLCFVDGDELPPLWHWMHFLPVFKLSDAGYDGHAALGGFLPPVPLPRRMWAGGRLNFHEPMYIGQTVRKVSVVTNIQHKAGQSGDLLFVTVQHRLFGDGIDEKLLVSEEHDIVYREPPPANIINSTSQKLDTTHVVTPSRQQSDFSCSIKPSPVLLFRYSALTFNGHRIHYDQPFCHEEGYDGLVVHGPLLATLLLELVHKHVPDKVAVYFSFRALAPVFDTASFSLHGAYSKHDNNVIDLWVECTNGTVAMKAQVTVR
eukprot:m.101488 g.101488  ORF g.101488 m.101488 type:complete len:350 (-) comp13200_c0_seq1:714-1763(-)